MRTGTLRQSGGSVILALPKPVLDQLGLKADAPVDIDVVDGKIVIARRRAGRVGLAARLAQCDFTQPMTQEERDWLEAPAAGEEAL